MNLDLSGGQWTSHVTVIRTLLGYINYLKLRHEVVWGETILESSIVDPPKPIWHVDRTYQDPR
jgi:hypothetical protein